MTTVELSTVLVSIADTAVKSLSDWLEEPIRREEHMREMERLHQEAKLEAWRAQQQEKLRQDAAKADLELQQMADDAWFARNKAALDAIKQYQIDLLEVHQAMIEDIGHLSLELREHAEKMVASRTAQYRAEQKEARDETISLMAEIQEKFPNNDRTREKMEDMVRDMTASIIKSADEFIRDLREDLKNIKGMIDELQKQAMKNIDGMVKNLTPTHIQGALTGAAAPALLDKK